MKRKVRNIHQLQYAVRTRKAYFVCAEKTVKDASFCLPKNKNGVTSVFIIRQCLQWYIK